MLPVHIFKGTRQKSALRNTNQIAMQFPSHPPLPHRNGIAPSYLWLPEGQWKNLLCFLLEQFPHIDEMTWRRRLEQNEILDAHGHILRDHSVVKRGMCIFYYREIEVETPIPFQAHILFQDQHLIVVDKPHFLPVTPGGRFLQETLLTRLRQQLPAQEAHHISPIHRLDRETAGVMLFSINPVTRGKYQALFQQRCVNKIYHAVAPHLANLHFPYLHESYMVEGEPFFIMKEIAGHPNAPSNSSTYITIIERREQYSLYELKPSTGKKHQLRVHLASLGAPIVNDSFYPNTLACRGDDFSAPLQLLAHSIAFNDPLTGKHRYFASQRSL